MTGRCETCGERPEFVDADRCNNCNEVERRIRTYLQRGGAKAETFIYEALLSDASPVEPGQVTATLAGLAQTSMAWELNALRFRDRLDSTPAGRAGLVAIIGRYRSSKP